MASRRRSQSAIVGSQLTIGIGPRLLRSGATENRVELLKRGRVVSQVVLRTASSPWLAASVELIWWKNTEPSAISSTRTQDQKPGRPATATSPTLIREEPMGSRWAAEPGCGRRRCRSGSLRPLSLDPGRGNRCPSQGKSRSGSGRRPRPDLVTGHRLAIGKAGRGINLRATGTRLTAHFAGAEGWQLAISYLQDWFHSREL